jgi:hypothetical protein
MMDKTSNISTMQVRNSHGKNWGENGNFRIKKGINSCGIEEDMAVSTLLRITTYTIEYHTFP